MTYSDLPTLNAILNASAAVTLLLGFAFIKRGRQVGRHKGAMLAGFAISSAFLASYVTYHVTCEARRFQGTGFVRYAYLSMLASHIVLAIVLVPLVLTTLWFALSGRFERHARLARWTFPIWIYVSVTGVLVYVSLYVVSFS